MSAISLPEPAWATLKPGLPKQPEALPVRRLPPCLSAAALDTLRLSPPSKSCTTELLLFHHLRLNKLNLTTRELKMYYKMFVLMKYLLTLQITTDTSI
jgi:hypothetical protein